MKTIVFALLPAVSFLFGFYVLPLAEKRYSKAQTPCDQLPSTADAIADIAYRDELIQEEQRIIASIKEHEQHEAGLSGTDALVREIAELRIELRDLKIQIRKPPSGRKHAKRDPK
jgi:hypothetical protein